MTRQPQRTFKRRGIIIKNRNKHPIIQLFSTGIVILCSLLVGANQGSAQTKSRILPAEVYQAMLDGNRQTGWVQFRNFNGSQWIYFTALQTLHCRLQEIRYSINSMDLDQRFALVKCNPQNPLALPPDVGVEAIALQLASGTAATVAVQVVWEDGRESDVAVYEPCQDVGEQSCAWPIR